MKDTNFEYVGDELQLFKEAHNWKNYWFNSIKEHVKGSVLEVGAGIGINTALMLNNSDQIESIFCVEPDQNLSGQIVKSIKEDNVYVHNGYLADLDSSLRFDTIMYIDVIEHIEDDSREVHVAVKYLKKGGRLIILVPAFNSLYSPFDKAIGHFRRYNKKRLLNSVPQDLEVVELFYLDSMGVLASLANKYVLKQMYPTKGQIRRWDNLIVPFSKQMDKIVRNSFGKSLVGIWQG